MFDYLRQVELFAELSDEDLKQFCFGLQDVQLSAGDELFKEGDPGDKAYVIREGKLEILNTAGGREVLIAV
ncbi:MAG: cyclic nucleotide-binding domain-containing protein, partial [Chloroflexota bacterium]